MVRPTGLHQMGLPCQLAGTGMAFPWECISKVSLATDHIVEDLMIGIELAQSGRPPIFCGDALLSSTFASTSAGYQSQRTRWEHGHIDVILNGAPRLLLTGLRKRDMNIIAMALDVAVPPLALLLLLNGAIEIAAAAMLIAANSVTPVLISSASLILMGVSVLISWSKFGRNIISLSDLSFAAFYAVIKFPLYVKFVVARQLSWVRSKREGED
jgi:cellulose synthase/poly-beta-1,6-N-acetylglucosamine synthase-like glycosyltransferase